MPCTHPPFPCKLTPLPLCLPQGSAVPATLVLLLGRLGKIGVFEWPCVCRSWIVLFTLCPSEQRAVVFCSSSSSLNCGCFFFNGKLLWQVTWASQVFSMYFSTYWIQWTLSYEMSVKVLDTCCFSKRHTNGLLKVFFIGLVASNSFFDSELSLTMLYESSIRFYLASHQCFCKWQMMDD